MAPPFPRTRPRLPSYRAQPAAFPREQVVGAEKTLEPYPIEFATWPHPALVTPRDRRSEPMTAGEVTQLPPFSNPEAAGTVDTKDKVPGTYSFFTGDQTPHKYLLELYENENPDPIASIELPYVMSIALEQPLSVIRTWTLEGSPYEEHSGFQQRSFSIQGRSGWSPRALTRFAKFRNFLEKYAQLSADNMNAFVRAKKIQLVLTCLWEGESWHATVMNFRYQREVASARVSYVYDLVLLTNGVSASRWNPKNGITYLTCSSNGDECHVSDLHYCHAMAEEVFILAPSSERSVLEGPKVILLKDMFSRGIPDRTLKNPAFWASAAKVAIEAQKELTTKFILLPEPRKSDVRRYVTVLMRWIVDIRLQALMILGALFLKLWEVLSQPNSDYNYQPVVVPNVGQKVISIIVSQGQNSAMDVAIQYLGNRNLWSIITKTNKMLDARTKSDGSPLIPGDRLLVPAVIGSDNVDPGTFYGTNLLFRGGDLVSVGDRDIALVSGIQNFYQNFRHRMLTVKGENRTYPEFGLPRLVGSNEISDVPGQLMSSVRRQVLSDHRVSEINEMTLTETGDSLDVSLSIVTALQEKTSTGFSYSI